MIRDVGGTAISVVADVTDAASIDRAVDRTKEAFGDCDILVNNAGILRFGPLDAVAPETWDQTIAVNVKGYL
ncbi:SDR family NAD(P)-dependent oxidoreductase, partial [Escherichia coli]|uniref:SDR family NAD(P)-dependent oxidoreductase n=1 Tax=Escherichia coli TaxID=562 RepID=UPI00207C7F70